MQIQTSPSTLNLVVTVESLLAELEELYPPFTPTPDATVPQIYYRSGQRSVVDWIKTRLNEDS